MIRYHTQPEAPHLLVELDGAVAGAEVREEVADLTDALSTLPDDLVMLATYPTVTLFKPDANPGLCVFVDGGQSPHPGLRAFIHQIELGDQVAFVRTREAADDRIQQYRRAQG
jgi:hypothetical protein